MIEGYLTIAGRDHRAMAGMSMGGLQSLQISLNLDVCAYIDGFSSRLPQGIGRITADPAGFKHKVKVLFLGTGTVEQGANPNIKNLHETLEEASVKHVHCESRGTAHEWLTWWHDLYQFTPLLFQD